MTKPVDKLRLFKDLDDLFDSNSNEAILSWVNELATIKAKQRSWGQRHRLKRKLFEEVASRLLQEDELARLREQVEEEMER